MNVGKWSRGIVLVGSVFFFGLLFLPAICLAGTAIDSVKLRTDEVLKVLRDPANGFRSAKSARVEKIRSVSEKMFDFTELSRRTLAGNWVRFSPGQQKEFILLYRSLLEDAYAEKILGYTDEKIVFVKEVPLTEKTAEVRTAVVRKNGEIPIYYRVVSKDGEWRVYDVLVEGVSLTGNYRSQFREMLAGNPPESLLETLREKTGKR